MLLQKMTLNVLTTLSMPIYKSNNKFHNKTRHNFANLKEALAQSFFMNLHNQAS